MFLQEQLCILAYMRPEPNRLQLQCLNHSTMLSLAKYIGMLLIFVYYCKGFLPSMLSHTSLFTYFV